MKKVFFQMILIALFATGCSQVVTYFPRPSDFGIPTYAFEEPTQNEAGIVQTAGVILTQVALETKVAATATPELEIITAAEATPIPESVLLETPPPQDIALNLGILSIKNGTVLFPLEPFDRVWRLRNAGDTVWNSDYNLVFVSGDRMGGEKVIPLAVEVMPGDMIDLRLHLTAPEGLGEYSAVWMLQNPAGKLIGMGGSGEDPLTIAINVIENPVPFPIRQVFEFYEELSLAEWYDQNGTALCEADGNIGQVGYVYRENEPHFQNGVIENEPAVVMIPAEGAEGFIAGKFPPIRVHAGDYFVARVGCLAENSLCDVTFKLAFQIVGEEEIQVYAEVRNTANDEWVEIRKNLTKISGQDVQFILIVENNQLSKGDYAAWFVPAIFR